MSTSCRRLASTPPTSSREYTVKASRRLAGMGNGDMLADETGEERRETKDRGEGVLSALAGSSPAGDVHP